MPAQCPGHGDLHGCFNPSSFVVCWCIIFIKKPFKGPKPCCVSVGFPFALKEANTSSVNKVLHLPAEILPLAQEMVLPTLCMELWLHNVNGSGNWKAQAVLMETEPSRMTAPSSFPSSKGVKSSPLGGCVCTRQGSRKK